MEANENSSLCRFTIIIPHKNIPTLLQRMLGTIPQRNDLQIIVVDDNSNSEKVDFSNFPGLERDDVEIIFTKEGKGAGYARNVGLQHAKGVWVAFADADDYYDTEQLNSLLDSVDDSYDAIYYFCKRKYSETSEELINYGFEETHDLQQIDREDILYGRVNQSWRRLIKRNIVEQNKLQFKVQPVVNDIYFTKVYSTFIKNYAMFTSYVYCYESRPDSLIHQKDKESLVCRVDTYIWETQFLKKIGKYKYRDNRIYIEHLKKLVKQYPMYIFYTFFKELFSVGILESISDHLNLIKLIFRKKG